MKILYFDCLAGISGDMTVAALLDAGVPLKVVEEGLALLSLPQEEYRCSLERVERRGMMAARFVVETADHHHHRHHADIAAMIEDSRLPGKVKGTAAKIFLRLAEAEAKVHGVPVERVHFHEVGAVDSIVDIVAAAICLDHLDIGEIHAAPLPWGSGFVETAHGRLPVPTPATAELMKGMQVHGRCGEGERVTPTGAAILAALASGSGQMPRMRVEVVGSGAGTRDFTDGPNVLRAIIGERPDDLPGDDVLVLECHIDDMNPEIIGFLMDRLIAAGALDVAFSPLQMKKNRPAVKLTVISPRHKGEELARLVFRETTTIGIRSYPVRRFLLPRRTEERETTIGKVKIKVVTHPGGEEKVVPEFDECLRLAGETGLPLREVYRIVERDLCR